MKSVPVRMYSIPEDCEEIRRRWSKSHKERLVSVCERRMNTENFATFKNCLIGGECLCKQDDSEDQSEDYKKHVPEGVTEKEGVVVYGQTPCLICGSTNFIRTGVCKVCMTYGSSNGCS